MIKNVLEVPAIRIRQGQDNDLYCFAVEGKAIPEFASISRVARDEQFTLTGYQRPEVQSHIGEIRRYLESENPMIPNAVVVAFDSTVKFEAKGGDENQLAGVLRIPMPQNGSDVPGFVVDGQQRLAAIRESELESFPVFVTSFITDDVEVQREQFILVNSTKPLSRSLIYELLPVTKAHLPSHLRRRRLPALLSESLNLDSESPFHRRIRTPTVPEGVIKDNSVLKMLENSLSDGVLYRVGGPEAGAAEIQEMLRVVKAYWGAVARVFPDAWEAATPRRSRLLHGAGIVSMGFVMDAIADRRRDEPIAGMDFFVEDLVLLEPSCRWTEGTWRFGPGVERKWNELQNTTRDIQLLSNFLLIKYRQIELPV